MDAVSIWLWEAFINKSSPGWPNQSLSALPAPLHFYPLCHHPSRLRSSPVLFSSRAPSDSLQDRRETCRSKKKEKKNTTRIRPSVPHGRVSYLVSQSSWMSPSPFNCFSRTRRWDHASQIHICVNDYERVNVRSAAKRSLHPKRGVWPTVELNFEMDWFSLETLFAQFPLLPSPYHLPYISYHWDSFMGPISSLAISQMMENWSLLLWYYSDCGPISEQAR